MLTAMLHMLKVIYQQRTLTRHMLRAGAPMQDKKMRSPAARHTLRVDLLQLWAIGLMRKVI